MDREGRSNASKELAKWMQAKQEHRLLPPPPEVPKQKIYMISGGEKEHISNRERKETIRQVQKLEEEVMEIQVGKRVEITFGPHGDRALLRPHNDALVVTIDVAGV